MIKELCGLFVYIFPWFFKNPEVGDKYIHESNDEEDIGYSDMLIYTVENVKNNKVYLSYRLSSRLDNRKDSKTILNLRNFKSFYKKIS